MAINPLYIASLDLQQYLVDKDTGLPLAGGIVTFYRDASRTELKPVYELTGDPPNYSFSALPNPVILSSVGTFQDDDGNDIIPYYLPVISESDTTPDLYYVTVFSSEGVEQFTREAWPPNAQEGTGGGGTDSAGKFNYIPNPQFLLHNNLIDDIAVPGTNFIGPGGWTFNLDDNATSTNLVSFNQIPAWTNNPPGAPPWEIEIRCTAPNPSEFTKTLMVWWEDVNKFSSDTQYYTFFFSGRAISANINITLNVYKFYGDGGLISGNSIITEFPVQTDDLEISRSMAGWLPVPDPNGFDIYLPIINGPKGFLFDDSSIGNIEQSIFPVPDPTSNDAVLNNMPADGASYIMTDYSFSGVPFARLGQKLIDNSPLDTIPMFGTGSDFITAYTLNGEDTFLRITYNVANGPAQSSPAASSGNSGWTVGSIVTYDASTVGSQSLGYQAFSQSSPNSYTILCVSEIFFGNILNPAAAGTSGFTITIPLATQGIHAEQGYNFKVQTVAASALNNGPTNPADYWLFSSDTEDYYMWFVVNGEVDPAVADRIGIKVVLDLTYTNVDVANIIREVMNSYQVSVVQVDTILAGQYWLFSSNPAANRNFYVWYRVNGVGTNPNVVNRIGIMVDILSSDTPDIIATKTQAVLNSYQYAAPAFQGLTLRGSDPDGLWDEDNIYRWSKITGLSGAQIGTFENSQFLSHFHWLFSVSGPNVNQAPTATLYAAGAYDVGTSIDYIIRRIPAGSTDTYPQIVAPSSFAGGSETRSSNTYVNFYIKY